MATAGAGLNETSRVTTQQSIQQEVEDCFPPLLSSMPWRETISRARQPKVIPFAHSTRSSCELFLHAISTILHLMKVVAKLSKGFAAIDREKYLLEIHVNQPTTSTTDRIEVFFDDDTSQLATRRLISPLSLSQLASILPTKPYLDTSVPASLHLFLPRLIFVSIPSETMSTSQPSAESNKPTATMGMSATPTLIQSTLLGGSAAIFAVNFTHPIELVKSRVQVSDSGLIQTCSSTMRNEGLAAFWKGLPWAYCREGSYTAIRLGGE